MLITNSFIFYQLISIFIAIYVLDVAELQSIFANNSSISTLYEDNTGKLSESTESTAIKLSVSDDDKKKTSVEPKRLDKFIIFLCVVITSEQPESEYLMELLNGTFDHSAISMSVKINFETVHDCADIYGRFIDCYSRYVTHLNDSRRESNDANAELLMIGPFCEISKSSSKFVDFIKFYFIKRQLEISYIIFSTAFNFIPITDDGYNSFRTAKESRLAMMLHGNPRYYADVVWHLMTKYFLWKSFVLLRIIGKGSSEQFRDQSCSRIFARLQWYQLNDNNFFIQEYPRYLKGDETDIDKTFKEIWLTIANVTRVVLLCADITNVGHFLKQVVSDGNGNKYGIIVMKSTFDDAEYFMNSPWVQKSFEFLKVLTYEPPLCDEYYNKLKNVSMTNKNLSLNERHKTLKFVINAGSYFCVVKSYIKFVEKQKIAHDYDTFVKNYLPQNEMLTEANISDRIVIILPILILHTYDHESGRYVKALKIKWTKDKLPTIDDLIGKRIKWHDENENLSDAPYLCNNKSTFYKCATLSKDESKGLIDVHFILINLAALIIFMICCFLCCLCMVFYSQMHLRRRWYLERARLTYSEPDNVAPRITTHFGMYKKMKVIVFDTETSLRAKVLQSKEVLQEVARIAYHTRTNSKFATFIGYTFEPPRTCKFVYEIGNDASLMRILKSIKLAVELKFSIIRDLVLAMEHIHHSFLHCHGDLRTDRCIIDERFMLRVIITRFPTFYTMNRKTVPSKPNTLHSSLLWTAPELIRNPNAIPTQSSDVYSFAIIVHEIVFQRGPFYVEEIHGRTDLQQDESCALLIVEKLKTTVFRPSLPFMKRTKTVKELDSLMIECWQERPEKRPTFNQIVNKLQSYMNQEHLDIAFNTGKRLRTVSRNMVRELVVKKQNAISERDRALKYLTQLMPVRFGYEFVLGHCSDLQPEYFENVTIYFNDLVEFNTIMQHHKSSYITIIEILDELFEAYDKIVSFYDVVPLHRVGSSLLLASGVPHKNDMHAPEIAQPALQIRHFAQTYQREKLKLRAGIHTGAVMSGIVGRNVPQFGLFGDTVNTASRMASTGEIDEIQMSEPVQKLLTQSSNCFVISNAGTKEVKGKGRMKLFWLKGYSTHKIIPLQRRLDNLPPPQNVFLRSKKSSYIPDKNDV